MVAMNWHEVMTKVLCWHLVSADDASAPTISTCGLTGQFFQI